MPSDIYYRFDHARFKISGTLHTRNGYISFENNKFLAPNSIKLASWFDSFLSCSSVERVRNYLCTPKNLAYFDDALEKKVTR